MKRDEAEKSSLALGAGGRLTGGAAEVEHKEGPPMRKGILAGLAILTMASAADAETKAMLQVAAKGRAGADRHRLILTETMPDGRDIMMAVGCRVDDNATFSGLIDFGAGKIWSIDGEPIVFETSSGSKVQYAMHTTDEYLVLAGREGVEAFRLALAAETVTFIAKNGITGRFNLAAVAQHVQRFAQLCALN